MLQHENIDVNATNWDGNTGLIEACLKGNAKIVELFLKHEKIDINIKNEDHKTGLMIAKELGYYNIVSMFTQFEEDQELQTWMLRSAALTSF